MMRLIFGLYTQVSDSGPHDPLVLTRNADFCEIDIGIKYGFPCITVCQIPREMLKTEAVGRGFQHLPRDLADVNVLENNVDR